MVMFVSFVFFVLMRNLSTINRRAARGAERLDSNKPDWWKQVDKEKLDMLDPNNCVLGQLYGSFTEGRYSLGVYYKEVVYGFDRPNLRSKAARYAYYSKLTEAWLYEIDLRIAANQGIPTRD